ncbi:hypothetical protein OTU49_010704, partial [Cherax quadricarinatus]
SSAVEETQGVALVELSASLVSPGVQVTPSLDEVQEAINKVSKIILSTARGVSQWIRCRKEDTGEPLRKCEDPSGNRRSWKAREEVLEVPAMTKNYYTHVYESKDVSKVMSHMTN